MTTLLHKTYPRTLYHLPPGARAVWLFENARDRAKASAQHGIPIHSAYKTLLSTVREQALLDHTHTLTLRYPVVDGDDPLRFRLECYPLPALYPHCTIHFVPHPCPRDSQPHYILEYPDGSTQHIPVPVRWRRTHDSRDILAACGWVEYQDGRHEALLTDYEALYLDACTLMAELPLDPARPRGPFFNRLRMDITLPASDERLPVGDEHLSLAEALHEDLYFSGLDIFRHRLALPAEDRSLTPGQILPVVMPAASDASALTLHIHLPATTNTDTPPAPTSPELATATHWLAAHDIVHHMAQLGGEPFFATSRQGRPIPATLIRGSTNASLALSAGQHANESSGIIAALRAAYQLREEGHISFTLRPLGNPDGYAAFVELCQHYPRHMQHGARYTASGCDLAYGEGHENALCQHARALLPNAWLHLNLHGYPAHEWTVPLSGYVPNGFSRWTIPKGYFLICRHHPDWQETAQALMDILLSTLVAHSAQAALNHAMLARYRAIVGATDFSVAHNCIPYVMEARADGEYAVEIITEAPDETTYGEPFRIAHESHTRVVLAAARFVQQHPT